MPEQQTTAELLQTLADWVPLANRFTANAAAQHNDQLTLNMRSTNAALRTRGSRRNTSSSARTHHPR